MKNKVLKIAEEKHINGDCYVIPSDITIIGENAFTFSKIDFSKIKCIDFSLAKNLKEVKSRAFFDIDLNVKDIILPNSLQKIGKEAFWGLDNLKKIIIPQSLVEIEDCAIANCKNCNIVLENSNLTLEQAKNKFKNVKSIKIN